MAVANVRPGGDPANHKKIAAERALLAALCQNSSSTPVRLEVLQRLAGHLFATTEHEVIFQALRTLPSASPEKTRAALIAALTRMGFPDVDLEPFFEAAAPPAQEIPTLLATL